MASKKQVAERELKKQQKALEKEKKRVLKENVKKLKKEAKVDKNIVAYHKFLNKTYVADFETTTKIDYDIEGEVRVNLWGLARLDGKDLELDGVKHDVLVGNTITEFFTVLKKLGNVNVYFHNLDFDVSFIVSYLMDLGFKHTSKLSSDVLLEQSDELNKKLEKATTDKQKQKIIKKIDNVDSYIYGLRTGEFTELRGNQKEIYQMKVKLNSKCSVTFLDSLKLYPNTSIAKLGKALGLGKLDNYHYEKRRPIGYKFDGTEIKYLIRDVKIGQQATLKMVERFKKHKLTLTGYAFEELKKDYNESQGGNVFYNDDHFPKTSVEEYNELIIAYIGGLTLVMPGMENIIVDEQGMVLDRNSMYPAELLEKDFPIGQSTEFTGRFNENVMNDKLYVQRFKAKFKLKDGMVPCLSKTNSFVTKNILSHNDLKEEVMMLTSIDIKHFFINYDVESIEYLGGYYWNKVKAPFKTTVEKFMKEKVQATIAGDLLGRTIAKLLANGLYGKFAQNVKTMNIRTQESSEGAIEFVTEGFEEKEKNYLPVAIFTTAYARDNLLTNAYHIINDPDLTLYYMDTDSLHFTGDHIPKEIDIDSSRIGAWDCEAVFDEAIYLRAKCYAERIWAKEVLDKDTNEWVKKSTTKASEKTTTIMDVKAAGIYQKAKRKIVNIEDFHFDQTFEHCKGKKRVKGGMMIVDITKKIVGEELDGFEELNDRIDSGFKVKNAS